MKHLQIIKFSLSIALMALLSACGGGGGSSSAGNSGGDSSINNSTLTGYFIDSSVQGVSYRTSSGIEGITSVEGAFNYNSDDDVSFYVGNVYLGTFTSGEILTVLESESPGQLAAFLQALDSDDNPENGIEITPEMAENFSQSDMSISEVSSSDSDFKAKFRLLTGKEYLINEQAALNHAVTSARLSLIKDTDLYYYYVGDINFDSILSNKKLLDERAERRINLYAFVEFIFPLLQTKAYQSGSESLYIQEIAENNKNIATSLAGYTSVIISTSVGIAKGDDLLHANIDATKGVIEEMFQEEILTKFEEKSPLLGGIAARALPIIDICISAYKGKEIVDKAEAYANCAIANMNLAFAGFTDAFAAYKLAGSVEQSNSLIVASAYLEAYYRNGGSDDALDTFYGIGAKTDDTLSPIEWRITNIAQKVLVEESSYFDKFNIFKSDDDKKDLNYSLDVVKELIVKYQNEVDEYSVFVIDKFGLDPARPSGFEVDNSSFDAYFISGDSRIVDANNINVCFMLENKGHGASLPIDVEINDVKNNSEILWSATGINVNGRYSRRMCADIPHGKDTSGENFIFGLTAKHAASNVVKTDAVIISQFFSDNYAKEQIEGMKVPYFDIEVEEQGLNIPEKNLVYGENYFIALLELISNFKIQDMVPNAEYSWQELYPDGINDLEIIEDSKNDKMGIFKFPPLTEKEKSRVYYLQLMITNPVSKFSRSAELKVVIENDAINPDETENKPPIIKILTDLSLTYGAGEKVDLSAVVSDIDGTIISTEWKALFLNSPEITNPNSANQAYIMTPEVDKVFVYVLTVEDDAGSRVSKQIRIKVKGAITPDARSIVKNNICQVPVTEEGLARAIFATPLTEPLNVPGLVTCGYGASECGGKNYFDFGLGNVVHSGTDYRADIGTPVYSPVIGNVTRTDSAQGLVTINFDSNSDGNLDSVFGFGHLDRFSVSTGEIVGIGDLIGYSGDTGNSSGPHLHVEYRPNYSNTSLVSGIYKSCGTDLICDQNEILNLTNSPAKILNISKQSCPMDVDLTNTLVTNIQYPTLIAGETATFTIIGESLPDSIAMSLHGAVCGVPYDVTDTQAKIDCTVPADATGELAFYIKSYSGGTILLGAENQTVVIGTPAEPPITPTPTGKLNDTGITWGGNYPSGNNTGCTGETIGEQDCSHGRDALAAAGQLTKVGGGMAGFDFTKLDSNGHALADQTQDYATQPWACVKDNHTGLIWEVKTPDARGTQLHSMDDRFNWYNTNSATNGGAVGVADDDGAICTGYDNANSSSYCNTQAFVARVNASNAGAGLCGATDWRLPDLNELQSIAHLGKTYPAIDENYFPNSASSFYWSSSPNAYGSSYAWGVHFVNGYDGSDNRSSNGRVRLVRSGQ